MKKIPVVELSHFHLEYCLKGTPFLWISNIYQFRIEMDYEYSSLNCYNIDSFSLILQSFSVFCFRFDIPLVFLKNTILKYKSS